MASVMHLIYAYFNVIAITVIDNFFSENSKPCRIIYFYCPPIKFGVMHTSVALL